MDLGAERGAGRGSQAHPISRFQAMALCRAVGVNLSPTIQCFPGCFLPYSPCRLFLWFSPVILSPEALVSWAASQSVIESSCSQGSSASPVHARLYSKLSLWFPFLRGKFTQPSSWNRGCGSSWQCLFRSPT